MRAGEIRVGEFAGVLETFGRSRDVILRGQQEGGRRFGYGDRSEARREGSNVLDRPIFCERRRGPY